jgi:GNAT superfamily N-acetyltransferase
MDVTERNVRLTMARENWDRLPDFALPAGYSVRWYEPGDERHWVEIHVVADRHNDITLELFEREFGGAKDLLKDRQCYLCDANDRVIGTATAWCNENFNGGAYGRVHWVAIVPEQQGRGLAKPLLRAICKRLRDLGHSRAYLTTSSARIAAINLYRSFGFVPRISNAEEAEVWRELNSKLDYPC